MHTKQLTGPAQALYRVFVLPTLSTPVRIPRTPLPPQCLQQPQIPQRPFSQTAIHPAKTRAPEQRTHKWNDEITSAVIYLVDPQTNDLSPIQTRADVMSRTNLDTHRLVQVGTQPDPWDPEGSEPIPICKVQDKKATYQAEKARKQNAKESKKASAAALTVKTLELNWAIDGNDLGHRLELLRGFLAQGRKVEVVLAAKKAGKGRKASKEECEAVLTRIMEVVGEVPGAKEAKAMEGGLGGFCTLTLQGKAQTQREIEAQKAGTAKDGPGKGKIPAASVKT